jgi:rhodanese-related sulfurtransferase
MCSVRLGMAVATLGLLTACGGEAGESAGTAPQAVDARQDGVPEADVEAPPGPDAALPPEPDASAPVPPTLDAALPPEPDASAPVPPTLDAALPPDLDAGAPVPPTPDAALPPDPAPDAALPPDPAPDAAPPPDPAPDAAPAPASLGAMSPAALFEALPTRDFRLINVHIPYAGEIPGTDVHIEYTDTAALIADLGPDRDRPAMVYCLTDHMALIAGAALVAEGYRRIVYLEGGMRAWVAAGYLLDRE